MADAGSGEAAVEPTPDDDAAVSDSSSSESGSNESTSESDGEPTSYEDCIELNNADASDLAVDAGHAVDGVRLGLTHRMMTRSRTLHFRHFNRQAILLYVTNILVVMQALEIETVRRLSRNLVNRVSLVVEPNRTTGVSIS